MKALKFLATTTLVLSLTSIYGNCYTDAPQEPMRHSSDVFLSSPDYTFAVEGSVLYLQPTASNVHYVAEAETLPAPSPNWIISDIHADYHFGFDVGVSGVFHSTHTMLMLNWERLHAEDSNSKTVAAADMVGPFFEIGPDATPYSTATGKVDFHFDEVSLDYGVLVNFGSRTQTNFFAGVSYVSIKETLTSEYISSGGSFTRTITSPSKFQGAGPQLGMNFSYDIASGFRLVGDGAAALYVGPMKNSTTYDSTSPLLAPLGISPSNVQGTTVGSRTQVVPGFEGKLGFAYCYNFAEHYMFSLEAGYEAQIYLNAIQSVDMGSEVTLNTIAAPSVGVYARTFQRTLSNFALAGPYLTLSLGF